MLLTTDAGTVCTGRYKWVHTTASSRPASRQVGFWPFDSSWVCAQRRLGLCLSYAWEGARGQPSPGQEGTDPLPSLTLPCSVLAALLSEPWPSPISWAARGAAGAPGGIWAVLRGYVTQGSWFPASHSMGLAGPGPLYSLLFCHVSLARQWTFSCPEPVLWTRT